MQTVAGGSRRHPQQDGIRLGRHVAAQQLTIGGEAATGEHGRAVVAQRRQGLSQPHPSRRPGERGQALGIEADARRQGLPVSRATTGAPSDRSQRRSVSRRS